MPGQRLGRRLTSLLHGMCIHRLGAAQRAVKHEGPAQQNPLLRLGFRIVFVLIRFHPSDCLSRCHQVHLYGHRVRTEMRDGALVIVPEPIGEHEYNDKLIPSGFFDQPLTENVSAVLFSNAGTIAKFDRMGVVAGFAEPDVEYIRFGLRYNSDPKAVMGTPFFENVQSDDYDEWWTDEVQVFHNPRAERPIDFNALPGAIHHYFEDSELRSFAPEGSVLTSYTMLIVKHEESIAKKTAL